jgi:hypothetical protein
MPDPALSEAGGAARVGAPNLIHASIRKSEHDIGELEGSNEIIEGGTVRR